MPDKIKLSMIDGRFRSAKTQLHNKLADFQRWEDWSNCIMPKEFRQFFSGENAGRPALVPPLIRTCLHDLRAKIVNSIFSITPHFELQDARYPWELLEKNRELIMFQFGQEPINPRQRYRSKVAKQIYDFLRYGIGIKRAVWRRFHDPISKEDYEGPGFQNVSPYRFYPSPEWDTDGNLAYYFILSVVPYRDLVAMAEMGQLNETAVAEINLAEYSSIKSKVEHFAENITFGTLDLTKEADKMICPVLIWNYVDQQEIVVVANEKTILKQDDNDDKSPNLGLSILNLGNADGSFWGESIVAAIEDNFIEKFHKRNQRLRAENISLGPQFITDDPNAAPMITSEPGRVHKVSPGWMDHYEPMKFEDHTDAHLVEEQIVTREIKEALGLNDPFMGQSPERRETATTQLILQQNAASDLTYTVGEIEDAVVTIDVQLMMAKNARWFPTKTPSAYRGLDIAKRDIIPSAFVKPLGVTQAISRPVLVSQITGLVEQWKGIPDIAQSVDWIEMARRQLYALHFPDPERILPEPTKKLIPILKENWMISQGYDVPVDPDEDHMLHDRIHGDAEDDGIAPEFFDKMQQHRMQHQQYLEQSAPQSRRAVPTNMERVARQAITDIEPQTPREETF